MNYKNEHYRAISWWLTWQDLGWPDEGIADRIKKRADKAAKAGVNCAIIFGTHFRWDYMPLWSRLHDMFVFISDELHKRNIVLFDHHSAVCTHRPRSMEDAWGIWKRNRHHVPFYPSIDQASNWTFEGERLNDWRMIDVETGEPSFLPFYVAEEFCINNPNFIKAYKSYVGRLVKETGIDGLMCDDGIFYPGWRACGCRWCRERFLKEYGHRLPPTDDLSFWGNRDSSAFKDWIEMRFRSSSDFLSSVKEALEPDFPFMACCSTSEASILVSVGMTYQDFIKSCNIIMLEMCGSTPGLDGTWDNRISSQLLHLGIARDNNCPCFGLGYAFSSEPAFFIWAFNKFLGSDTWFSTLKGRLGVPDSEIEDLPDDPELVGEGFIWEKNHAHLFKGKSDTQTAVFFSRSTRDYYGQIPEDYVCDYQTTCNELMKGKISFEVVTEIPDVKEWGILLMSSAACLSGSEAEKLHEYIKNGGTVIATGMLGLLDERAKPAEEPWLKTYGIEVSVDEPKRTAGFPPYEGIEPKAADSSGFFKGRIVGSKEWISIKREEGWLLWCPSRIGRGLNISELVLKNEIKKECWVKKSPQDWYLRIFRDRERILIHGLPAKIEVEPHPRLKKRYILNDQEIVYKLHYKKLPSSALEIAFTETPGYIKVYSPDLDEPRPVDFVPKAAEVDTEVNIDVSGISRYFIVEISL